MAPRVPTSNGLSICAARTASKTLCAALNRSPAKQRGIAQSYLKKVADGDGRWEERASKIQSGELRHVWDILDERGFIKDVAGYVENVRREIVPLLMLDA